MSSPSTTTSSSAIAGLRQGARWGYAAKGVIYLTVGALSGLAATGFRKAPVDTREAVRQLFRETHSDVLLWTLCVALALFAGFRLYEVIVGRMSGQKVIPWWKRVHLLISASIHGGFAFWIFRFLMLGTSGPSSESKARATSISVFSHSFGSYVAFAVGIGVGIAGLYQFYRCYSGVVRNDLHCTDLSRRACNILVTIGRIGEAARGAILCIISGTIFHAALHTNPNEVRGFAGALQNLRHQPSGEMLLLVLSAGFISLGFFLIFSAKYQKL